MMASKVFQAGAAFLVAGLLVNGCSHAWDVLEPLPGSTGTGGGASASGTGGLGGASATSTTSSAGGAPSTTSSTTSSAQGTGGAASSSSAESSASAASSSASSGTGGGATAYYGASFAACNSDMNLDIAACELLFGNGSMDVDGMTDAATVTRGFVRFDLDSTVAGKTVDSVTLRLTVLNSISADSDHSGEIWEVQPFDATTLGMGQPLKVGAVPLGADLGAVLKGQDYFWGLPKSLVVANGHVYLAVYPKSANGVHYWNDHGTVPPLLTVIYH